jgi:hypothetical protein
MRRVPCRLRDETQLDAFPLTKVSQLLQDCLELLWRDAWNSLLGPAFTEVRANAHVPAAEKAIEMRALEQVLGRDECAADSLADVGLSASRPELVPAEAEGDDAGAKGQQIALEEPEPLKRV